MEYYNISNKDKKFHIDGFPDAVKVISIDEHLAKRLSDLSLHKADLDFANASLDVINQEHEESSFINEALWRSAIVHFLKCFGNDARFQLSPSKIYKGEPQEAMLAFNFFKNLRNKHVVHDENSYTQSIPGAILNDGTKDYKIEKIVCFTARGITLGEGNFGNLKLLIEKATIFVVSEFDMICEKLTDKLEKEDYDKLLAKKSITYTVPIVDEIHKTRRKS